MTVEIVLMDDQLESKVVYVTVIHRPTNRGFTLDRGYALIIPLIEGIMIPEVVKDFTHGWLPTMEYQRPEWTHDLPETEFSAYWSK